MENYTFGEYPAVVKLKLLTNITIYWQCRIWRVDRNTSNFGPTNHTLPLLAGASCRAGFNTRKCLTVAGCRDMGRVQKLCGPMRLPAYN